MNYQTEYTPVMARLIALFPQRPIGAETIAAYWDMLSDMDGTVFAGAVKRCADECDWFPTIKQIRDHARDVAAEAHGVLSPPAAWLSVLTVARQWTERTSVRDRFDGVTWDALQAIGGIRVVNGAESGYELAQLEKAFTAHYERAYQEATNIALEIPIPNTERTRLLASNHRAA